jgi:hypothetical protein
VDRALEVLSPWAGPGRPLLVDGRARFLTDVLEVFTDWPVEAVEADAGTRYVTEPPLVFVQPMNAKAKHWALPGAAGEPILERYAKLEPIPGGGDFTLGESAYRVLQVVPWTQRHVGCRIPPPPESGMSPPPEVVLLRVTAPACAAEVPIRVRLGGEVLAERLQPGYQFLAVPRRVWEAAGGLELEMDAEAPISENFQPVWMHPDAPLEMRFGPGEQPSFEGYLSEEFREFAGLRNPVKEYPYWEAPVRAREFGGDGSIRLPEGLGGGEGGTYVIRLVLNALHGDRDGTLAVTVSLPEFPEVEPQTVVLPHSDHRQEFRYEFRDLPRAPGELRVHTEHDVAWPPAIEANPRHANVQVGGVTVCALRRLEALSVEVGEPEDGTLLGEGFFRRENTGTDGHGRWTGGECEIHLPLTGRRDYRLEMDYGQLRPPGEPPAEPQLELNGHPLETAETATGLEARLPAEWLEGTNRLIVRSGTWSPADHGAGDDRRLGIFLRGFRAEPI